MNTFESTPRLPIVISGITGGGKSTVSQRVQQITEGAAHPLRVGIFGGRYTTRQMRPDEREGVDGYFGLSDEEFDAMEKRFLYSYEKYGTRYGFCREELYRCLNQHHTLIVGGEPDTSAHLRDRIRHEASMSEGLILDPVTVHIHRPLEEILEGIEQRQAPPAEKRRRIEHVRGIWDKEPFPAPDHIIENGKERLNQAVADMLTIIARRTGHDLEFLMNAVRRPDVRHPARRQLPETFSIPDTPLHRELRDALGDSLRTCEELGVRQPLLMGGVGAAVLVGKDWPEDRPLSRDLDYLVPHDPVMQQSLERHFGGEFKANTAKPVFKSHKLQGIGTHGIDLDFISQSNIIFDDASLSLEHSPLVTNHAVRASLLGVQVDVLPPELIVLQKLFAGRGRDLGKFDLTDATCLLQAGIIDPDLFDRYLATFGSPTGQKADVPQAMRDRLDVSLSQLPQIPIVERLRDAVRAS
ncbi:MAG TPA: hypothetical protein VHA78_01085 [Candidatus Peribacteraceae bacterium]|nr:hypothetical protein [Candidatus Peribacteraceae bacterium]